MIHFSKLRLYGFKSFVDKTDLEIGPGLNGIVGPNGCGKSNLVEALRWVMGEKSAKNMRGGGMEDVIFAGTAKRPARNMAEVVVVMDNRDGGAPAPFENATEIEINRRIEKDKGSQYRVNGKAVRARDVNLLFADTMTGAGSPSLVSQGRITEIITAKPSERRRILEESAGIGGLHTRRHEAELRLRAAEQNLNRLNDSLNELRTRLSSLKRQARQAERYKELNDAIRRLDLAIHWSEWSALHQKIRQDKVKFSEFNDQVQEALQTVNKLTKEADTFDEDLSALRKKTMEAQAILQNFRLSLDRMEQDIKTRDKRLHDTVEAKAQLEKDRDFMTARQSDLLNLIDDASAERETASKLIKDHENIIPNLEIKISELNAELHVLVEAQQSKQTEIAVAHETRTNTQKRLAEMVASLASKERLYKDLESQIEHTQAQITQVEHEKEALPNFEHLKTQLDELHIEKEKQANKIETLKENLYEQNEKHDALKSYLATIAAEIKALENALAGKQSSREIIDDETALYKNLTIKAGYEKAVSSALGQWLMMASMNENGSVYWQDSNATIPALEKGVALINFVTAPETLNGFLRSAGYVETLPDNADIKCGQMLVDKDGGFLRWDGLRVHSDAAQGIDQSSFIFEQQNKLKELQQNYKTREASYNAQKVVVDRLENDSKLLQDSYDDVIQKSQSLEKTYRETEFSQTRINDRLNALNEKISDYQTRANEVITQRDRLSSDIETLKAEAEKLAEHSHQKTQVELDKLSQSISELRLDIQDKQTQLSQLISERDHAQLKAENLAKDIDRATKENEDLSKRLDEFEERFQRLDEKIAVYQADSDGDEESLREDLLSKIAAQDAVLKDFQNSLEEREAAYKVTQNALRHAEAEAATAREKRAAAQAGIANAESELKRFEVRIFDTFELSPQALEEKVFTLFQDSLPPITTLQHQKDETTVQRQNMGPVNLRASVEMQENEIILGEMEKEYDDLIKAIEHLRGGIAKLNREAKDRLAIAFERVNHHFKTLFEKLFVGGQAYLEMIHSDDPLDSGLEIFAQPPGKSLQKLSLLSGGEQTLTSIALIFAMFLTNPSPICVLDEIDAPLDDANVDRVCTLMEDIAAQTKTRFIVITHHRMTMARMDRLYGVTMAERGVSQLVSVDMALQEELELAETA